MTYTCASLFSGGGGFDIGAKAAGFIPVCASEYDPAIAAVYAENLGNHIRVGDILEQNPATWPSVDLLHASPPCPNFSTAKTNAAETPHDIALATKVAEFIAVLKPRWFTLENVQAYRKSASFAIICKALAENGYWYDAPILNSADFGVPQTRQRLFLRAVRGGMVPPLQPPTRWIGWYEAIADIIDTLPETEFAAWQLKRLGAAMAKSQTLTSDVFVGGANKSDSFLQFAIENRPTIPGIRNSDDPMNTVPSDLATLSAGRAILFSRTELVTLQSGDMVGRADSEPSMPVVASDGERPSSMARAFIPNTNKSERDDVLRDEAEPAYTVTGAGSIGRSRAFIMRSSNVNQEGGNQVRFYETPAMTISAGERPRAFIVDGKPLNYAGDLSITPTPTPTPTITSSQTRHQFRAWLSKGRVVKMTPRALARFQSFPDSYVLPAKVSLACRIIGNAVPPLLAESVCRSLVC